MGNTYCVVCCVGLETVAEYRIHLDTVKHKKNRVFQFYQHDKQNLLKNPHVLGLEIKLGEAGQGVVHTRDQGLITITTGPSQAKSFELILTNTRSDDVKKE